MADEDEISDHWLFRKLPKVGSCCFVLDVETGSMIVGCIGAVVAVIFFIVDVIYLAIVSDIVSLNCSDLKVVDSTTGILIFDLLVEFALIVANIYLIFGIAKKRWGYIKAWIIMSFILTLSKFISAIVFVAYGYIFTFLICLFYTGFQIYYTLIVNSYYLELDTGGRHY